MNAPEFIEQYSTIETSCFIRKDRNKKHMELVDQTKATDFTCSDIVSIVQHFLDKKVIIRQPFYSKLIYPILTVCAEKDNVEAMKVLIKLDQQLYSYQVYSKDYKYSIQLLLEKALLLEPNDIELLTTFESERRRYICHTLHEIPIGVLYDMDGADMKNCDDLIQITKEYELVCKKLNVDRKELLAECYYYYPAYKTYLDKYENYENFLDFLGKELEGEI